MDLGLGGKRLVTVKRSPLSEKFDVADRAGCRSAERTVGFKQF